MTAPPHTGTRSIGATPTAATPTGAELSEDARAVAETLVSLMRTYGRARAKILAAAAHDVEWSAQMALKCLANEGPMRSSELAEHTRTDPSTVSRQVAALVKEGLVERRADPADGRACLLVLTDQAAVVLAEHDEIRNRHFAGMLTEWSERDVRRFAQLLGRFTDDFQTATRAWLADKIDTGQPATEDKR